MQHRSRDRLNDACRLGPRARTRAEGGPSRPLPNAARTRRHPFLCPAGLHTVADSESAASHLVRARVRCSPALPACSLLVPYTQRPPLPRPRPRPPPQPLTPSPKPPAPPLVGLTPPATPLPLTPPVYCNVCNQNLGWTYLMAHEQSQKYKEGERQGGRVFAAHVRVR